MNRCQTSKLTRNAWTTNKSQTYHLGKYIVRVVELEYSMRVLLYSTSHSRLFSRKGNFWAAVLRPLHCDCSSLGHQARLTYLPRIAKSSPADLKPYLPVRHGLVEWPHQVLLPIERESPPTTIPINHNLDYNHFQPSILSPSSPSASQSLLQVPERGIFYPFLVSIGLPCRLSIFLLLAPSDRLLPVFGVRSLKHNRTSSPISRLSPLFVFRRMPITTTRATILDNRYEILVYTFANKPSL
ncbi:hypothetical protein F5B21DRAFT_64005 [Xylaria acuta]|nr:hypothetical protein F5B21DRAFT_64005 [Xylaria acuta]